MNVARISAQKNQQLLLRCMKFLEAENSNILALIIGDYVADDKKIYDELMSIKPGNVHFIGKVSNVGDYLLNADAFVLSSVFEGLPISLLEALSAGAIPIGTPVGGLKDVITPEIGFLSDDVSEEKFIRALHAFISTPAAELERKRKQGKVLFEQAYSMKNCAAKYCDLYFAKS